MVGVVFASESLKGDGQEVVVLDVHLAAVWTSSHNKIFSAKSRIQRRLFHQLVIHIEVAKVSHCLQLRFSGQSVDFKLRYSLVPAQILEVVVQMAQKIVQVVLLSLALTPNFVKLKA